MNHLMKETLDYWQIETEQINVQFFLISSSLIAANIILMVFVSMYWLNSTFHSFLTGKPL